MDIVAEFDKKLTWREGEHDPEFEEGREQGLAEGRELALIYDKYQQEQVNLVAALVKQNTALREEIDQMRQRLGRDILDLVAVPKHLETRALVDQSVIAYTQTKRELDTHECECDCFVECDCEGNGECYQDCEECS